MSLMLILIVLAIAAYLAFGLLGRAPKAQPQDSVAAFSRALTALDPQARRRPKPRRRPRARAPGHGRAGRSGPARRPAADKSRNTIAA